MKPPSFLQQGTDAQFPYGIPPPGCPALATPAPGGLSCRAITSIKVLGSFLIWECFRGAHSTALLNIIVPGVPLPFPLPAVGLGAGCFIGHCGERWDSSGELCCAFCPRARSLSGQWQEAPASPSAGAGAARGRCSARAALFGADKLRKPGRRMEGSVRNLGPGAAGLSTGFPRPGHGVMILESA